MAFLDILKFIAALALVLSLIGGCAWLATRLNLLANFNRRTEAPRLSVRETLIIDAKHKLMIVANGEREHTLLFGPSGDVVIETRASTEVGAETAVTPAEAETSPGETDAQPMEDETIISMVKESGL